MTWVFTKSERIGPWFCKRRSNNNHKDWRYFEVFNDLVVESLYITIFPDRDPVISIEGNKTGIFNSEKLNELELITAKEYYFFRKQGKS